MNKRIACLGLLGSLVLSVPLLAADGHSSQAHEHDAPARLVHLVREATRRFIDVNNAGFAEYGPFLGCVSGPDHGAMGIHYVNGTLLNNLTLDASKPQALIYEPVNDQLRLVGVEFILDAAKWLAKNNNTPPVLEGQVFNYVSSPNHVWAWRDNPQGAFVDWNNHVSCNGQ